MLLLVAYCFYNVEKLFQDGKCLLLLLHVSGEVFQCDTGSVAPEMRLQVILHHRCTFIYQIVEGVVLYTELGVDVGYID